MLEVTTGKGIHINFDQMDLSVYDYEFDKNIVAEACKLSLNKKRTFVKCTDLFAGVISSVFQNIPHIENQAFEFMYATAESKKFLDDNPDFQVNTSEENMVAENGIYYRFTTSSPNHPSFLAPVDAYTMLITMAQNIYEFIGNNIVGFQVDQENQYRDDLQFTSEHCKLVLTASYVAKFILPFFCTYAASVKLRDTDMFLVDLFTQIINEISEGKNLPNKIKKLVESRILSTQYSDRVIWNYLTNAGTNAEEHIISQYWKVITDIFPKLEDETNVINYFHVVLTNQLTYLFKSNLPINYKPLSVAVEADEVSLFDRHHARICKSELDEIVNKNTIDFIIDKFKDSKVVSYEEFAHYNRNLPITREHQSLIYAFFNKWASNHEIFFSATSRQFYTLLLIVVDYMEKHGMPTLARACLSKGIRENSIKRKVVTRKFILSLENSHLYADLQKRFTDCAKLEDITLFVNTVEAFKRDRRVNMRFNDSGFGQDISELELDERSLGQELLVFLNAVIR